MKRPGRGTSSFSILVFDFTKKKLEDYMAKKSAETTTVAHFGNVGENKRND